MNFVVFTLLSASQRLAASSFVFIYLAVFGSAVFYCCAWAFSSCCDQMLLFIELRGLLIAVASLVSEHGLQ